MNTDYTEIGCGIYQIRASPAGQSSNARNVSNSSNASQTQLATVSRQEDGMGQEFQIWDFRHSKLAALILKGFIPPITESSLVLYLGAASGSTASHISDIVQNGLVYVLEFSPTVMKKLISRCESRQNMIPIFADANHPERYAHLVDKVDIIYQDIAQRNQAEIALANAEYFLKDDGYLILMIKARSIDSTADTKEIFKKEVEELQKHLSILKTVKLPGYRDHLAVIAKGCKSTVHDRVMGG
ncbi:MAG: fibrillarin-like rRNA/tRNA 2'-O-methyltransferase [Euryarchaeota archaeon]|nr:fibrillarin-like rRNA/tRNA 2'-O-methyltransferase [Euryarchaeota archaeon]